MILSRRLAGPRTFRWFAGMGFCLALAAAVSWGWAGQDPGSKAKAKPDPNAGQQDPEAKPQPQKPYPEPPPLPEGLRQVPANAMAFVHIRVGDFLAGDAGQILLKQLGPMAEKIHKDMARELGVPLGDVDSITLVFYEPPFFGAGGKKESKPTTKTAPSPADDKKFNDKKDFDNKKFDDKKFDDKKSDDKKFDHKKGLPGFDKKFDPPLQKPISQESPVVYLGGQGDDYRQIEDSKKHAAITQMKTLAKAVEIYYLQHNSWPQNLRMLLRKDELGGPYLGSPDALRTPWGGEYLFHQKPSVESGRPVITCDSPFGPLSTDLVFQPGPGPDHPFAEADYPAREPLIIVTTTKPYDRRKLLRKYVVPEPPKGLYEVHHRFPSVVLLSDRSYLLGEPRALARYADQAARDKPGFGGPLQASLAMGLKKSLIVAGAHFSPAFKKLLLQDGPRDLSGPQATLFPLLHVQSAGLTLDLGKTVDLNIQLRGSNGKSAALAGQAARAGLTFLDLALEEMLLNPRWGWGKSSKGLGELLAKSRKALEEATLDQQGAQVRIRARMELDAGTLTAAVAELIAQLQKNAERARVSSHLHQIGIAMHSYHDSMKRLPPAALTNIADKDGKPLLSWRVAILPYIEQAPLYNQFNLKLPWDNPENMKLVERMPPIYALPGRKTEAGKTYFQVFVGPGTVFEPQKNGGRGIGFPQITDGTSNTLMVVEAAKPVIWTKPDDLPFHPQKPLPKLGGNFGPGFYALLCDGSVRFIDHTIPERTLRALITRDGGEVIDD